MITNCIYKNIIKSPLSDLCSRPSFKIIRILKYKDLCRYFLERFKGRKFYTESACFMRHHENTRKNRTVKIFTTKRQKHVGYGHVKHRTTQKLQDVLNIPDVSYALYLCQFTVSGTRYNKLVVNNPINTQSLLAKL